MSRFKDVFFVGYIKRGLGLSGGKKEYIDFKFTLDLLHYIVLLYFS